MPPSIWLRMPSGLTASPLSTAATTRGTRIAPRVAVDLAPPSPRRSRRRGSCSGRRRSRVPRPARPFPAEAVGRRLACTSRARSSCRWARRKATGSAPAACASSSMKLSIANTFICAPSPRSAETRTGIRSDEVEARRAHWAARRAGCRCGRRRPPASGSACGFGGANGGSTSRPASRPPALVGPRRCGRCSRPRAASRRCGRRRRAGADISTVIGRAERLPAMLLLAHPLQAHRPAGHGARGQRCVGRDIVGAVVAVAARALDVDAAHLLGRQAAAARRAPCAAGRRPGCASRPSRCRPPTAPRRRTGRSSRASGRAGCSVRCNGARVGRRRRAGIVEDRHVLGPAGRGSVLAHVGRGERRAGALPAGRLQATQRLDRLPFVRRRPRR